jgi:dipeptidase D
MNPFKDLKPEAIWHYFYEISQTPRPSGKEEEIIAYLKDFAQKFKLEVLQDKTGNLLIKKPATTGKETSPTVILQSHIDMVCEKISNTVFDFDNDPLKVYVKEGWVSAEGTTLGGDDGIGTAAELALLASTGIAHPALECLFTVEEETGLTGAFGLEKGFLTGSVLINLDSEDDAEVYVGCAGGVDTLIDFNYTAEEAPQTYEAIKITVNGLSGGHSGGDVHLNRGNANIILSQFIAEEAAKYDIRLTAFNGGNLRNAIPREAYAIVQVADTQEMDLIKNLNDYLVKAKANYAISDPHLLIASEATDKPAKVIDAASQRQLLNAINMCPIGVIGMSESIEGLVETSTNLASVKMKEEGRIQVVTSQRSSSESAKKEIAQRINDNFKNNGGTPTHSDGYPGWSPNLDSNVLKVSLAAFHTLHKEKPEVKAIHAGLECGLFLEKYPDLDMISIGPTIKDAHSPDESMEIKAVGRFWDWLLEILKNI